MNFTTSDTSYNWNHAVFVFALWLKTGYFDYYNMANSANHIFLPSQGLLLMLVIVVFVLFCDFYEQISSILYYLFYVITEVPFPLI